METVGLLLFGVAVGLISGLMGIGGGIVIVPGLMMLFGFSQTEAQGTSLAVLSVPVVLFAACVYYQNGNVQLHVVGKIVAGFAVGAYIGARLVTHVPVDVLRLVMAPSPARMVGPAIASMLIYVLMAVVLFVRPAGLFPAKGR